MRSKNSLAF